MPTWYDKATSDTLLAGKAALASPAFTGTPTIGGVAVAKTSDLTAAINTAVANLVGAAPSALDTLKEIDDQLTADEGAAAALAATVAGKEPAGLSTGTKTTLAATYRPLSAPMLIPAGSLAREYDSRRNVYNLSAGALRRYRAARGLANEGGTNLCRIVFAGDSQTGGTTANPATQSFPRIASNRLAALGFPLASKGTAALSYKETASDSRYSFTSGWANLGVTTDAMAFLTNSNTNPLTYTSDTGGTVVELAMLGNASPVTVTIDGVSKGTTVPSGQQNNQIFTYTGLADTTHTVVITPTSSDSAHVLWVDVREPSGISILNAGIGGSRAQQWAAGNFYGARAIVKGFAPSLVVLTLGTNDLLAGRTPAQFKADLTTVATDLGTNRDLILGTPVDGNNLDFTAYRAAIYAVADTLNVPVIDLGDRLGSFATANGNGVMADDYHPRARGYHDLGTNIGSLLAD